MKIPYYPGCTLKTTAKNFESSAIASAKQLGIEMEEMPRWNCCGTVYSLASDDLMHQIAPIRNLARVQEAHGDKVVTLCAMCYNTLKQANLLVKKNPDKLNTLNLFMDDMEGYEGNVKTLHPLEIFRDEYGFEKIKEKVKKPLNGLKVVPYYGCLLTRPTEVAIDDAEEPLVLKKFMETLGAEVVNTPYKIECCGSYHTVNNRDVVAMRTYDIITSAAKLGGEAIVLSCPLCEFNLDARQKDVEKSHRGFKGMPVLYFTQLLAIALGLDESVCGFEQHYVDPRPLLKRKGLVR
jgi:heterodisulfide reductase subunit B